MFSGAFGYVDEHVRQWVHDLVNGLYGFLHNIFGLVGSGWNKLVAEVHFAWQGLADFMREVTYAVSFIIHYLFPALVKRFTGLIDAVKSFALGVYHFAVRELNALRSYVDKLVQSALTWVTVHVYDPLHTLLVQAWNWITSRGETIWHYISNPGALVDLVWDFLITKLEAEAWTVGEKLGSFFLSLVIHNVKRFALLLEDIITAIL